MPDDFGMFSELVPAGTKGSPPAAAGGDFGMFANLVPASSQTPSLTRDPPTQVEAAGQGFLKGVTSNLSDEMYGAAKASGSPEWDRGYSTVLGLGKLAYEHLTGQRGPATEEYERARDEMRARHKQIEEEHPGAFMAGQLGGALVLPGGAAMQAATLPARMARGAAVGAGYGAAAGLGEGEGAADSAARAAIGAPVGAAIGAAAPPLIEGVIGGTRAVTAPIRNAFRSAVYPEAEAARRVRTAIQRDVAVDPAAETRLTPQEWTAAASEGTPVAVMDVGGGLTRRLADSAAITSPEGATALNRTINDRFESQSGRVSDWLRRTFNYPDPLAQQQALEAARAATLNPMYRRAYREGDRVRLWDDDLEQLVQSPDVQSAIPVATQRLRNWAVAEGFDRPQGAFVIDRATGRTTLRQTPNGEYSPSLQLWDYIKQALDERGAGATGSPTARQYAHMIRSKLDELLPSSAYQDARSTAAGFFGARDALEAGQNFVTSRMANGEARQAVNAMSQTERGLFQDGFVSRLVDQLGETGDRRSVLNQIMQSPAAIERINIALGPQRARDLEAQLRVEGIMDLARGAVQGNSWTARRLYDLGLAGGSIEGIWGAYHSDPAHMTAGALFAALSSGGRRIDQRVARRVAEMLASDDPQLVQQAVRTVANNGRLMNALRSTDQRIALAGGEQSGQLQITNSAHASELDPALLPAPQEGTGDRTSPVQLEHPDDVHYAAGGTVQPSPAQAEAGNYKKRHLRWKGLDIAIETERGGERTGMGPDGMPWSTVMAHPYGYIKRTTGRDDDPIDVYVGPRPHSQHVFVIDQADPKGGKFDEHKIIIGARDAAEAHSIYDSGFSDGTGPTRRAAVTEMTIPQLKMWLVNGDTTAPASPRSGDRRRWSSAAAPMSLQELFEDPRSAKDIRENARPDFTMLDQFADGGDVKGRSKWQWQGRGHTEGVFKPDPMTDETGGRMYPPTPGGFQKWYGREPATDTELEYYFGNDPGLYSGGPAEPGTQHYDNEMDRAINNPRPRSSQPAMFPPDLRDFVKQYGRPPRTPEEIEYYNPAPEDRGRYFRGGYVSAGNQTIHLKAPHPPRALKPPKAAKPKKLRLPKLGKF